MDLDYDVISINLKKISQSDDNMVLLMNQFTIPYRDGLWGGLWAPTGTSRPTYDNNLFLNVSSKISQVQSYTTTSACKPRAQDRFDASIETQFTYYYNFIKPET